MAKVSPPKRVDRSFLDQLRVGSRLFHYPANGDATSSFEKSASVEHTLYSVIDLPTVDEVVLLGLFDQQEKKKAVTRDELLNGEWWYAAQR